MMITSPFTGMITTLRLGDGKGIAGGFDDIKTLPESIDLFAVPEDHSRHRTSPFVVAQARGFSMRSM
jgi:hypothetical protein